jgi:hypothetical protein
VEVISMGVPSSHTTSSASSACVNENSMHSWAPISRAASICDA